MNTNNGLTDRKTSSMVSPDQVHAHIKRFSKNHSTNKLAFKLKLINLFVQLSKEELIKL